MQSGAVADLEAIALKSAQLRVLVLAAGDLVAESSESVTGHTGIIS